MAGHHLIDVACLMVVLITSVSLSGAAGDPACQGGCGLLQSRTYGFLISREDFTIGNTVVIPKGSISPVWIFVVIGARFLLWFFLHVRPTTVTFHVKGAAPDGGAPATATPRTVSVSARMAPLRPSRGMARCRGAVRQVSPGNRRVGPCLSQGGEHFIVVPGTI